MYSQHWREGGTFLTNFSSDERPLYEETIRLHGDANFFIEDEPLKPSMPDSHSLHYKGVKRDLSEFWQVFRELKAKRDEA